MARYIKANALVAKFLNLEHTRNAVKDGNYLFWQNDMLAFGPLTQLSETLRQIGGIALMPHEAREEQDGVKSRPLPIAEDKRFIFPESESNTPMNKTDVPTLIPETGDDAFARSEKPVMPPHPTPEPEVEWIEGEEQVAPLNTETKGTDKLEYEVCADKKQATKDKASKSK